MSGGELGGFHRVDVMTSKRLLFVCSCRCLAKRRVDVRQDDPVEAIVFVELLADDGAHSAHADDHCVRHKVISSLPFGRWEEKGASPRVIHVQK